MKLVSYAMDDQVYQLSQVHCNVFYARGKQWLLAERNKQSRSRQKRNSLSSRATPINSSAIRFVNYSEYVAKNDEQNIVTVNCQFAIVYLQDIEIFSENPREII